MTTTIPINSSLNLADSPLGETSSLAGVVNLLNPLTFDAYSNRGGQTPEANPEGFGIEDCSDPEAQVVAGVNYNPLFAAAHKCFADHRPLVLSPDMIFLAIAQGVANHINNNSEQLRSKFVEHPGRAEIIVRRDDFVKGSKRNPWPEAFNGFSEAIRDHIGEETHSRFKAEFSTTGPIEQAANDVVLMDSVKSYFKYVLMTRCGIPSVELEGTTDDWKRLQEKVAALHGAGIIPDWWNERLVPICHHFVAASQGNAEPAHWRNIYKWEEHSGGDGNDGWLTHLLPYIRPSRGGDGSASEKNPFRSGGWGGGIATSSIPGGLCSTPFIWDYYGTCFDMSLMAGFVGMTQDEKTLALRPKIGWVVRDNKIVLPSD